MAARMHADEIDVDPGLVSRLLAAQLPHWADLPLERVPSAGTDNALYRLGDDMTVRLPRIAWAVGGVDREYRWLPRLAPHLPVEVPAPLARGVPGEGYPWPWAVYTWLSGENPVVGRLADPGALARDLGGFVTALHAVDTADGPPSGRGGLLSARDEETRAAIEELEGMIDTPAVTAAWEAALRVAPWPGPPVWLHADISPGNVLLTGDRLSGVIDFGGVGVGEPAADLIAAWNLLPPGARDDFRDATGADDATWGRGRGWALSIALIQLPYYRETNPALAGNARHVIREVVADHRGTG